MRLTTDKTNVLIVPDDLSNENLERFYDDLNLLLRGKPLKIHLDCSRLLRVTSTHVNLLWDTRYSCHEAGTKMHLSSISESLYRVLKVLDLYEVLVDTDQQEPESTESKLIPEIDPDNNVIELEIKPLSDSIGKAALQLKNFLVDVSLQDSTILEIETIFYEVTTNIRLHSHMNNDGVINLNVTLSDDKIAMRFTYPGMLFDPTARVKTYDPGAFIRQRQKRGYGLIMINRMADKIGYERLDDNINLLNIEKYWGGPND